MSFFQVNQIAIDAVSSAVPVGRGSICDYEGIFGPSAVEKFTAMTGVKEFRRCGPDQTASDLGFSAAEAILSGGQAEREEMGALIFVSQFPDYRRPATACVLHKRLGLKKDCVAFDINLGCSAFVYGLQSIASIMATSDIEKALLIVSETVSKTLPERDPTISMLFGDAGSATLLSKRADAPPMRGLFRTIGSGYKAIIYPLEGFRNPGRIEEVFDWPDGGRKSLNQPIMNGRAVFEFTITEVPKLIRDFLSRAQRSITDYDAVILHQANTLILKQLAKKFGMTEQQMPITIDRFGNTSGVSLPLTLCDARDRWNKESLRVLFCGFGIGLSLGVVEVEIARSAILGVFESDATFPEGIIRQPEDLVIS